MEPNSNAPMKHPMILQAAPISALLLLPLLACAEVAGPYTVDVDTLHLWHLDESSAPAADAVGAAGSLQGLLNNATLGNASYTGFGTALNTFTSNGGTMNTGSWKGGLLLARPALANSAADNVPNTFPYMGTDGAFTYEAIIKLDPELTLGQAPANNWMQIFSMDDEGTTDRVFQFRLQDSATPLLSFLPFTLTGGTAQSNLQVAVPLAGDHALAVDTWFHVAVTYNGVEGAADNMAFYWTKLDSTATAANLLGTATMNADLNGRFGDFALGNEARDAGESENFAGLIDEVRISGVARTADQFVFVPEPSSALLAALGAVGISLRRRHRP